MHSSIRFNFTLVAGFPRCAGGVDAAARFNLPDGLFVDIFELKVRDRSTNQPSKLVNNVRSLVVGLKAVHRPGCLAVTFHTENNAIDYESVATDSSGSTSLTIELPKLLSPNGDTANCREDDACMCTARYTHAGIDSATDTQPATIVGCTVPVHLRYYSPEWNSSSHEYTVATPDILVRCASGETEISHHSRVAHEERHCSGTVDWVYSTTFLGASRIIPLYADRFAESSGYFPLSREESQVAPSVQTFAFPVGSMQELPQVMGWTLGTVVVSTVVLLVLLCVKLLFGKLKRC